VVLLQNMKYQKHAYELWLDQNELIVCKYSNLVFHLYINIWLKSFKLRRKVVATFSTQASLYSTMYGLFSFVIKFIYYKGTESLLCW